MYYNGQVSVSAQDVVICPIWFMVVVGVAVMAVGALIARLIYKHRQKESEYAI